MENGPTAAITPDPGSVHIYKPLRPDPGSVRPVNAARPLGDISPGALAGYAGQTPVSSAIGSATRAGLTTIGDLSTRFGQSVERQVSERGKHWNEGGPLGKLEAMTIDPGATWEGLKTLVHGDIQSGQYQKDTEMLTQHIMGMSPQEYAKLPGWQRQANEFVTQTIFDPLTVLGFGGFTRAGFEEASREALPAVMRASRDVPEPLQKLGGWTHDVLTPGGRPAAHTMRTLAAKYGPRGVDEARMLHSMAMARDVRASDVEQSLGEAFHRAVQHLDDDAFRRVENAIHTGTTDTLKGAEKEAALRVQQIDRAIPYLAGSKAVRSRLEAMGYQLPDELRRFDIGQDFGPVDARPRGAVRTHEVRFDNHVPIVHDEFAALRKEYAQGDITGDEFERRLAALQHETGVYRGQKLTAENVQFRPRGGEAHPEAAFRDAEGNLPSDYVARRRAIWQTSFRRAGKQIANADLQRELSERFAPEKAVTMRGVAPSATGDRLASPAGKASGAAVAAGRRAAGGPADILTRTGTRQRYADVPKLYKEFFREESTGSSHPFMQGAGYLAQGPRWLSEMGRGSLFAFPTQHPLRIAGLLAMQAPERLPAAVVNLVKARGGLPTFGATPERMAEIFGPAERAGAVGLRGGQSAGTGAFQRFLGGTTRGEGVMTKPSTAWNKFMQWTKVGPGVARWYQGVNNFIWRGADPSLKKALYDKYVTDFARMGHPSKDAARLAAHEVQMDMVNYERASPAVRAMAVVSWFPTWRLRMPVAVARAIAKNPQMVGMAARLNPALVGGEAQGNDVTGGVPYKLGAFPLAESPFGMGAEKYARGTLNPYARLAGEGLDYLASGGRGSRFLTNYLSPQDYALSETPGLNITGYGYGKSLSPQDKLRQQLLYQLLGIEPQNP